MANIDPVTGKNKGGRPVGAVSRIAADAREKALATGMLPHEILLSMARGEVQTEQYFDEDTGEVLTRLVSVDLESRRDAAKAAAPYFAPKMSTVEVLKTGTDDELDRLIAELAAQTGFGSSAVGETTTGRHQDSTSGVGANISRRRRCSFDD